MTLFVTIVYVLITIILILVVLLQAGKGGGLGTALGGGSSQSVFGGGGGADFLAKLTQGLAIGFMVCAVYLAYASTHSGSSRLKDLSQTNDEDSGLVAENEAVNYERIGRNPLPLPPADAAPRAATPPPAPDVQPAAGEPSEAPVAGEPSEAPVAGEPSEAPVAGEPSEADPAMGRAPGEAGEAAAAEPTPAINGESPAVGPAERTPARAAPSEDVAEDVTAP